MQTTSSRSLLTSICGLLLLLAPSALFGEGFRAGTLVATPSGFCAIEMLVPGDRVISRAKTGEETEAIIIAVSKRLTTQVHELIVDGQSTLVDKNQRFYVANKNAWCSVDKLSPGDLLVSPDNRQAYIEDIQECDKKLRTLYMLSVARHHNFCIGQSKLLAHNITADFTAAQAGVALAAGTGLVVSLPVACVVGGTAAVGYGIYSLVDHLKKEKKSDTPSHDQNTNRARNGNDSQEHVRVRGFDFTNEEMRALTREQLGLEKEPVRTGACLPETKQSVTPSNHCPTGQDKIEKDRSIEPRGSNNAALDPDKVPPCGRQGQTLPSLDSKTEAKDTTDSSSAKEQAKNSQPAPAQAEAKHESTDTAKPSATPPTSSNGSSGGTTQPAASSKPDYQSDGYAAARLAEEDSVVDAASADTPKVINELADLSDVLVKVEGRKESTGRTDPEDLEEKLAMNEVMSNPSGEPIVNIIMKDTTWPAQEGWAKMHQVVKVATSDPEKPTKIVVHYVYNESLGLFDDFKFKKDAKK